MFLDSSTMIAKLGADDSKCFDEIYRHYYPALCSFSSQYVRKEAAEGVVQETMLWLWENRTSLIPEMSLKSLLFTIVKNKSLNIINQNNIKQRIHQKIIEKFQSEFENPDFYLGNELLTIFEDAINKLPEEYRKAFVMNRLDGLTHKEIALQLNVSPQTINYRISQALKILRVKLKDYLPLLLFILK